MEKEEERGGFWRSPLLAHDETGGEKTEPGEKAGATARNQLTLLRDSDQHTLISNLQPNLPNAASSYFPSCHNCPAPDSRRTRLPSVCQQVCEDVVTCRSRDRSALCPTNTRMRFHVSSWRVVAHPPLLLHNLFFLTLISAIQSAAQAMDLRSQQSLSTCSESPAQEWLPHPAAQTFISPIMKRILCQNGGKSIEAMCVTCVTVAVK